MPYFEYRMDSGKILKILIDTGSNKNYIRPKLVKYPKINEEPFSANSVGGEIKITHHTIANIFGEDKYSIKFFILKTLQSFDAILGNDSSMELSAVINVKF